MTGKEDAMRTNYMMNVDDVMEELGVKRSKAYSILKQLNDELAKEGYVAVRGKIPRPYWETKFYGCTYRIHRGRPTPTVPAPRGRRSCDCRSSRNPFRSPAQQMPRSLRRATDGTRHGKKGSCPRSGRKSPSGSRQCPADRKSVV